MKKIILLFLVVTNSSILEAQFFDAYSIGFSVNRTDLVYPSEDDTFNEIRRDGSGFAVGIKGEKKLSDLLDVTLGIEFSYKQVILDLEPQPIFEQDDPTEFTGEFITSSDAKTGISLISIPANLNYNLPRKFKFFAGPFIDIKLGNTTDTFTTNTRTEVLIQEENIFDYAENLHLGYNIGLGKYFSLLNKEFEVSVHFRRDITKMIRAEDFVTTRRQSFEVWLGIPIF